MGYPEFLYKYLPLNQQNRGRVEDIFVNNRIYFCSPKEFNDPFDCCVELSPDGTEDEWRDYLLGVLGYEQPNVGQCERRKQVDRIIKAGKYRQIDPGVITRSIHTLGIYCLSAVKDEILLWSHYSEKHTGMVLEFKSRPGDTPFGRAQPVEYREQYPNVSMIGTDIDRWRALVLTKSKHWEYEKEYRIIDQQNGPGLCDFPDHLLAGVILGCKMPERMKADVRQWISARSKKPLIYQAVKMNREFRVSIEAEAKDLIRKDDQLAQ